MFQCARPILAGALGKDVTLGEMGRDSLGTRASSLIPGHDGKAKPLLQEAFPDEPAQVPVQLSSSFLNACPHLCSLGKGPPPDEAGDSGLLFLWTVLLSRPIPRSQEGGPVQELNSGNGKA